MAYCRGYTQLTDAPKEAMRKEIRSRHLLCTFRNQWVDCVLASSLSCKAAQYKSGMGGFSESPSAIILAASSGASEGDSMTAYAYLFKRSDSGSEFILVPMGKDFSKIPRWIAGSIGSRAPFPELHLNSDVPLPGIDKKSLKSEIEKYGYAIVEAHFELRQNAEGGVSGD